MVRVSRMIPHLAAVLLLAGCGVAERAEPRVETLAAVENAPFVNAHAIIILRHGDIDTALKATLGNQVPLTAHGQERAREVITALRDAGITRIVTSTALRTQQTAAPLAAELHIKPETPVGHGAEGPAATMAGPPPGTGRALASPAAAEAGTVYGFLAESAKPADTILLVHHHSVIPSIMAEFGFSHEPAIDDATEFDRVYVILPDAEHHTYHLLRLRYGGKWSDR